MEYFSKRRVGIPTPQRIEQESIQFQTDVTVSGRSVAVVNLTDPDTNDDYSIPSGYRLILGIFIISCELDLWQHAYLVVTPGLTPGLIGDYHYFGTGQIYFHVYATATIDAGTTPSLYIFNEDAEELDFSIAISAVEEKL